MKFIRRQFLLNSSASTAVSLVGERQVLQAYATQPSSNSNNKGSKATVSNLTEQLFKAYLPHKISFSQRSRLRKKEVDRIIA